MLAENQQRQALGAVLIGRYFKQKYEFSLTKPSSFG
jgi:hypothetical protein